MTLQSFLFQIIGWLVGLPLEFLVISALFRGPYRRFPLIFAYTVASFVLTLLEVSLFTESYFTHDRAGWARAARIYWFNEGVLQLLMLSAVISLIHLAIAGSPKRRLALAGFSLGALIFGAASFFIHYRPLPTPVGYWMTPWSRDISVCATVLDLALWMALIASRKRDRALLLISGALGMQFTGAAIGEAIRKLSMPDMVQALSLTGSVVAMVANLACLYIWWQTFRSPSLVMSWDGRHKKSRGV